MNKFSPTRIIGTSVFGIRMPIISSGDNIDDIICDTLLEAAKTSYLPLRFDNHDIIGITESFLARSQNNYASLDDIAAEVAKKFPTGDVAIAFPILSRNRFVKVLEALAKGISGKVYVILSYPDDEVGNPLIAEDVLLDSGLNPYSDTLTASEFKKKFGECRHPITQTDYIKLYEDVSDKVQVILLNNPKDILQYTNQIIVSSIHKRHIHRKILEKHKAIVMTLDEICCHPSQQKGWSEYGLLGSNYADNSRLKLFPRQAKEFCLNLQKKMLEKTGKTIEVMIYGDGGFKDPVHHIWEFADPVVSPGFTDGLTGMPHEIKIKAVADNNISNPTEAISKAIAAKVSSNNHTLGTTPRRITDLVGSLCDLTSGSGDKGTPVIYIKGYFDDYTKDIPA